jgi:S1-C subfamily serine protease
MKKYLLGLVGLVFSTSTFCQATGQQKLFDTIENRLVLRHQVLLTNQASFKGHKDEMSGASAFLINYRDKIFAVTAKHVLGEAMGVEPEIKLPDFNKYLIVWKMFPRMPLNAGSDTVLIGQMKLNYDSLDKDILLLEVVNTKFNIFPLTPNFSLPKKGDKLYIIGCPYSQNKCKQNIYEIFYDSFDSEASMLNFIIKTKFELPGFSGAPIVDSNGHVVGVLTSGWSEGNIKFIGGTFIKEIQKLK